MCNRITLELELKELEELHQTLDRNIINGYSNYLADPYLNKMKQEKLIIKREIESVRSKLSNPSIDILR
jgi:hypothetical protein